MWQKIAPFAPAIAAFIAEAALQISGYTNPPLALGLLVVAVALLVIPAWPYVKAIKPFAQFEFQWPIRRVVGQRGRALDNFLWVGRFHVSTARLESESVLVITATGFNGSGHRLRFDRITGVAKFRSDMNQPEYVDLPPLQFANLHWTDPIEPRAQFALELIQRFPIATAAEMVAAWAGKKDADLCLLNVAAYFRSVGTPKIDGRIPLWGGLRMTQCGARIDVGQVIYGGINVKLGPVGIVGKG